MKTQNDCSKRIVTLLGLLAGTTFALAAPPPANTGVGVGVRTTTPGAGIGLGAGASGGAMGGVGARGSGAQGAAGASGTLDAGGAGDGRVDAFESLGMRQERTSVQAANAGGNASNAPGMARANYHAIAAVLDAGPEARKIRELPVTSRATLATEINDRLDANADAMADLKARSKTLSADSRIDFKAAMKDVDAREKELKASVKVARKASDDTWADSRAKVAANYEAYAQSVSRAEAIVVSGNTTANAEANAKAGATARP